LYDFNSQTYFYRNRVTGEFSRINPILAEVEARSSRVPPKNTDPLWKTDVDPENGANYWTDLETGRICYERPAIGTFVSELPLREFRKPPPRMMSLPSRKSIRSLAILGKGSKESTHSDQEPQGFSPNDINDDEWIFEDLSRGDHAKQYDAAAMFGVGK
jgi:hypothetical protein